MSVRQQGKLLSLVRSGFYYSQKGESAENLKFMEIVDKKFLETSWYGSPPPLVVCKPPLPAMDNRLIERQRRTLRCLPLLHPVDQGGVIQHR